MNFQQFTLLHWAAVLLVTSTNATADVYEYDVAKIRFYVQSTDAPPTTVEGYVFNSYIDCDKGDASSATINSASMIEEGPGQWNFEDGFASQAMLDMAYPSGSTYTLQLSGGSLGALTEQVLLPMPAQYPLPPAFTAASFNDMQNADPSQALTIEWEAPDTSTTVVFMSIYSVSLDDTIFDDVVPLGQNSYMIPASTLLPNDSYEVEIVFANAAFGSGSPAPGFGAEAFSLSGYASVTVTAFDTNSGGPISFDGGVLKSVQYRQAADDSLPGNAETWALDAFIDAGVGAIEGGSILGGDAFEPQLFEYAPGVWDVDDPSVTYNSKAAFDADFPSQRIYTMDVFGGTLGMRNQTFPIGQDGYPSPGRLTGTVFSDLQGMDPNEDFLLQWSIPDASVDAVALYIDRVSDFGTVFEIILPESATQLMIPAGLLESNVEYELGLTFANVEQFSGSGAPSFDADVQLISGFLSDTLVTFVASGDGLGCVADLTGDGVLNFFDVSAFLVAFNGQLPDADLTDDGIFNFFDVSAFLVAFAGGC